MCFSATASFAVGGALAIVGSATLHRARRWQEVPLASLPLLFAGHQTIEGLLWLKLLQGVSGGVQPVLVHAFLLFALVLLPVLVPTSTYLVEPRGWRRRGMFFFILWSCVVAAVLLAMMVLSPYEADVHDGNIRYRNGIDLPAIEYLYAIGVTVPLLMSSHRALIVLGLLAAVLFAFTKVIFSDTYVSVWCFLAAIASTVVLAHFIYKR